MVFSSVKTLICPFSPFSQYVKERYLFIESDNGIKMSWEYKYGEGALEEDSHT